MPASTVPVPYIDANGYHMPAFADVLSAHQADYQGIYGSDIVLTSDTQDGGWVAIEAQAFYDTFSMGLAVYNSFSPATAQGAGLSSVVKVNGIQREAASYSTSDLTLIGVAGTILTNCQARDEEDYLWAIPTVTIPLSGQIIATATCTTLGAITAPAGTINQLATPTLGWQSVANAADATPGAPVETDPQLRVRQSNSTMLAATGVVDGIAGAIAAIPNVARYRVYENDTALTDSNGVPGHSISAVVDGGDEQAIALAIAQRKLSAGTYGTSVQTVTTGIAGIPRQIYFYRPTEPPITYTIAVSALPGFTTDVQAQIQQAVSDWTNAIGIGAGTLGRIKISRAEAAAELIGTAFENTFEITSIAMARDGNTPSAADVPIAFDEAPSCTPALVTVIPS